MAKEPKNKLLYKLRVDNYLTQAEMAERCGVGKTTYHLIESGGRRGSQEFWQTLQSVFGLGGEEMWKLQNPEI